MGEYCRAIGKPYRLYTTVFIDGYDFRMDPKITGPNITDDMMIWIAHKGHAWIIVPESISSKIRKAHPCI